MHFKLVWINHVQFYSTIRFNINLDIIFFHNILNYIFTVMKILNSSKDNW